MFILPHVNNLQLYSLMHQFKSDSFEWIIIERISWFCIYHFSYHFLLLLLCSSLVMARISEFVGISNWLEIAQLWYVCTVHWMTFNNTIDEWSTIPLSETFDRNRKGPPIVEDERTDNEIPPYKKLNKDTEYVVRQLRLPVDLFPFLFLSADSKTIP